MAVMTPPGRLYGVPPGVGRRRRWESRKKPFKARRGPTLFDWRLRKLVRTVVAMAETVLFAPWKASAHECPSSRTTVPGHGSVHDERAIGHADRIGSAAASPPGPRSRQRSAPPFRSAERAFLTHAAGRRRDRDAKARQTETRRPLADTGGFGEDDGLRLAANLEQGAEHSPSAAIVRAVSERKLALALIGACDAPSGRGVIVVVEVR